MWLLGAGFTHVLVGNDLDILDVTSGLEDLSQDVLGDAGVEAANVESALVGLGSSAAAEGVAGAGGRHDAARITVPTHGRRNRRRDGIGVLGNVQRRRRHVCGIRVVVLTVLVTGRTCVWLRWRGELSGGGRRASVSHVGKWSRGSGRNQRGCGNGDDWGRSSAETLLGEAGPTMSSCWNGYRKVGSGRLRLLLFPANLYWKLSEAGKKEKNPTDQARERQSSYC